MSQTVLSESLPGGVRLITLNRPERLNAILPALLEALIAALDDAEQDPACGALVLTGAGRAFCAGDDLKDFDGQVGTPEATRAYVERIQEVTRRLLWGEKPVIGAIHGWAVGGGLEWVVNCDFAIAAEGTRFFFPEVSWGLFVTGGVTSLLPARIGVQRTRELILFGERFDARQALDWGLLWKVLPPETVLPAAIETARRIAALPPGPVRALKRILARPADLETRMAAETEATLAGFLDPETARRIRAFSARTAAP